MEYSTTERGNQVLIYNGYEYVYFRRNNDIITWRCRQNRLTKCHSIVKTERGIIVQGPLPHCHDSCPQKTEVNILKRKMKEAITDINATPRTVIGELLSEVCNEVMAYMPKVSSLSKNFSNYRRDGFAQNPTSMDFAIPEKYMELVLHDTGINTPGRILALGNATLLNELKKDTMFGDGTFDKVPNIFYQLYTWHAHVGNSYPPCVYFLLQNKTLNTYNRMLDILKLLLPNLAPQKVLVDFEKAAIIAVTNAFPNAEVKGCYFHLSQSIIRKINNLGLKSAFESDLNVKLKLKSLAALAFVPVVDVRTVFYQLAETFPDEERYNEILIYFFSTYIEGPAGRNAQFSMQLWNHFDTALEQSPKTTNCCEGFHNALNSLFHCSHPNMWNLFDGLKRDIACHRLIVANAAASRPERVNKRYKRLHEALSMVVQEYNGTEDKLSYLKKVANLQ